MCCAKGSVNERKFVDFFELALLNHDNMLKISLVFLCLISSVLASFPQILVVEGPLAEMQYADREDLREVVVPDISAVVEIPDYAFLGCRNLRKVKLGRSVKTIGFQAFSECESLETVELPDSLVDIGSNAFAYCSSLDSISFPASLKHIGHNAFSFCESLQEVTLPDSIEEIESYAFSDCSSLRKAKLPANGNLLGELIFNCCASLEEIIEPSLIVPEFDCGSWIFDPEDEAAYRRCILRVPASALRAYDVSNSWQRFNKIAIEPSQPKHR